MENEYELLAGFTDKEGKLHKTVTLREMTGADQEILGKAEFKNNSIKAIHRLLASCVESVGNLCKKDYKSLGNWETEVIQKMYTGDLDYILIELRKLSLGNEITVTHKCPNPDCGDSLKTEFDLGELRLEPYKTNEVPFELPNGFTDKKGVVHKAGKIRLPIGLDREVIFPTIRKNRMYATNILLSRICTFDDGTLLDFNVIRALGVKDIKYLAELLKNELAFGYDTDVETSCPNCGTDFVVNIAAESSGFFI